MIPKKIHYCWIGGNPKPKLTEKCIKSWKKFCPDYEIIEWNENNYDFQKNDFMREAYEEKKWGFVPDYARLDIIYEHGGIYLDTDVEIVKPLDTLLENRGFIGFENKDYLNLGQGFGAEAGNGVIKALLESYEYKHFLNPDGSLDMTPSPRCDSLVLEKLGVERNGKRQKKDGFLFLPPECLNPMSSGELAVGKDTYSIHWFAGSWYSDEERKQQERDIKTIVRRHYLHIPNRIGRKILGNERYERLKELIKGK